MLNFLPLLFLLAFVSPLGFAAGNAAEGAAPSSSVQKTQNKKLPIYLQADELQGRTNLEVEASGKVELRQGNIKLNTDRLYFLEPEQEVTANGAVHFERDGDIINGSFLKYDLDSDRGHMDGPTFRLAKTPERKRAGRGDARRIDFLGDKRERLTQSRYTTCAVGQDDWFLRVKDLELDRVTEVGTARNASVEFMGIPFLYLPWVSFPLSDKRKTGFLPPVIGATGRNGLELSVPYYWNIAPNMDATFIPRLLSKRGIQLQNEFR